VWSAAEAAIADLLTAAAAAAAAAAKRRQEENRNKERERYHKRAADQINTKEEAAKVMRSAHEVLDSNESSDAQRVAGPSGG
jgi:hypothetical protein